MELSITVMLSHLEEIAREHVEEQIQRGLSGYSVHLILEDAGETPIFGGIGSHLDFTGDAVRDVTDEFD